MRLSLISLLSIIYFYSFAQVPNAFNYQGQVRDDSGNPIIIRGTDVSTTGLKMAEYTAGSLESSGN